MIDRVKVPVALVTRMDEAEESVWGDALSAAMPEETVVSFRKLTFAQRQSVEVAVLANPDPADVVALPSLQWAHSLWAGVERLVAELGVSAPPIVRLVDPELSRVMAEAVLAWTYYLQRDMPAYHANQQQRKWAPRDYRHPGTMTVGLIGLGELGSAAAARLLDAGFNVCGWSRSPKALDRVETLSGREGLKRLLEISDIVVCLVPLTPETRGLLDGAHLARMKKGAAIVNFARGPIIVAQDLLAALGSGHLSHAVLDVFDEEPLASSSPFWQHPAVTVLPHISGPTNRETAAALVAANIRRWRQSATLPATIDIRRGY